MRFLKLALLFLFAYLLQSVILSRFALLGVRPDLLLIVTALYAVTFGAEEGFIGGVFCGLAQDILSGFFFMHTISKGFLGFLIGTLKESVLGTEEAVVLSAVVIATVTNYTLELILLYFFFGKPVSSAGVLLISLLISCVFNGVVAYVLAPSIRWALRSVTAAA